MSILKRFRERLRAQDWLGVGLELAIVIVGVFIGIQVSNWNDDRIVGAQASGYRADIVQEVALKQRSIATMTFYYGRVRQHAIDALAALETPRMANGEGFLIDAFQATQILPYPLGIDTFEEVRGTPVINVVAPLPLQKQLANYEANVAAIGVTLAAISPYRDLARSRMPFVVQEKIQAACGDSRVLAPGTGFSTIILPETCDPGLTPAEAAAGVAALRGAPDIRFVLNRQISDLDQKLKLLNGLAQRASMLMQSLRDNSAADQEE